MKEGRRKRRTRRRERAARVKVKIWTGKEGEGEEECRTELARIVVRVTVVWEREVSSVICVGLDNFKRDEESSLAVVSWKMRKKMETGR